MSIDISNVKIGDMVETKWDDSETNITAKILRIYRGHRGKKFIVRMPDGTKETVEEDQVV